MFERPAVRIPFKKITTVLATVFGISLGLCGVTFLVVSGGSVGAGGRFFVGLGMLELVAMALSAVGLLLTLLVFVAVSIVSQSKTRPEGGDDTRPTKGQ